MSLTPKSVRLDKKCGASGIPDHKKCRVGSGSQSSLSSEKSRNFSIGAALGTAASAVGTAYLGYNIYSSMKSIDKSRKNANKVKISAAIAKKRLGNEIFLSTVNKAKSYVENSKGAGAQSQRAAEAAAVSAVKSAKSIRASWRAAARRELAEIGATVPESAARRRRREKRKSDSVFAEGFTPRT